MVVDSVVYYGISFVFLVPLFLFLCIKKKINTNKIHFLITLFLFSSFLALGSSTLPSLVVNYILRKVLPFFDLLAVPARHSFLAFFSLSLIHAFLIYKILKKRKDLKFYLPFLWFFLLLLEYFPINYNYYYIVKVPPTIYEISLMAGNFTILNIPSHVNTQGMYLQTIHQKRILDGYTSRISQTSKKYLDYLKIIKEGNVEDLRQLLTQLNVKYIIVNNNYNHSDYDFSLVKILELVDSKRLVEACCKIQIYEIDNYKS
jgi:hypothetical protein